MSKFAASDGPIAWKLISEQVGWRLPWQSAGGCTQVSATTSCWRATYDFSRSCFRQPAVFTRFPLTLFHSRNSRCADYV